MIKKIYRFLNPKFQSLFLDYKVDMKPRYGHGNPAHPQLNAIVEQHRDAYKALLTRALDYIDVFHSIKTASTETDPQLPVYNNGFLPGLDIIAIYTILRQYQPRKYVEVGSGNSTKVAYKAKVDGDLEMEITSIDPYPRAEIDQLVQHIIREPFENVDLDLILSLEENDVLFIDNSHRILPNSDSMVFYMEVLPLLKPGVIVHIHDIYLPFDYPQFMCDRAYSEQYGLAMYLLANPDKYVTLFPSYFVSQDKILASVIQDLWAHENLKNVERHGGSYWLRIAH
jgi:predicted O-methyltransferase YrrM